MQRQQIRIKSQNMDGYIHICQVHVQLQFFKRLICSHNCFRGRGVTVFLNLAIYILQASSRHLSPRLKRRGRQVKSFQFDRLKLLNISKFLCIVIIFRHFKSFRIVTFKIFHSSSTSFRHGDTLPIRSVRTILF